MVLQANGNLAARLFLFRAQFKKLRLFFSLCTGLDDVRTMLMKTRQDLSILAGIDPKIAEFF
jgi:hypothetical protein